MRVIHFLFNSTPKRHLHPLPLLFFLLLFCLLFFFFPCFSWCFLQQFLPRRRGERELRSLSKTSCSLELLSPFHYHLFIALKKWAYFPLSHSPPFIPPPCFVFRFLGFHGEKGKREKEREEKEKRKGEKRERMIGATNTLGG